MLDLDDALDHLAPHVDVTASRHLFDERRSARAARDRRRRRVVTGVAAALVLVLGIASIVVARADRDTTLQVADGTTSTAEPTTTDAPTTTGAPTTVTTAPAIPNGDAGEVVATVPLPPAGGATSHLLDDGMPIWVVHHADGTASAVPGVTRSPFEVPGDGSLVIPDGVGVVVSWTGDGFAAFATWDAWGRSIGSNPGLHPSYQTTDLIGFDAEAVGDQVLVRRSTQVDIPGDPVAPTGPADPVAPVLPPPAPADDLPEGWSVVETNLIGDHGTFRFCDAPGWVPGGTFVPCPPEAPVATGLTTVNERLFAPGPLLVRVGADGAIAELVRIDIDPLGGDRDPDTTW